MKVMKRPFCVEVAGLTDVGRMRSHNEDNFAIVPEYGLCVVADGMGGHDLGELASQIAVDTLCEFFVATADDSLRAWSYELERARAYEQDRLITGIKLCNHRIYEHGQTFCGQRGMGTTICTLVAVEDGVYIAHVGDSRVYRIRDARIEQLTEDHSLLEARIIEAGSMPQRASGHRGVSTKAELKISRLGRARTDSGRSCAANSRG
jgi:serine/threonine protein phosphatase PrpC